MKKYKIEDSVFMLRLLMLSITTDNPNEDFSDVVSTNLLLLAPKVL